MSVNFYRAAAMQPQYFDKHSVCSSIDCLNMSVKRVHCDKTIATSGNILIARVI